MRFVREESSVWVGGGVDFSTPVPTMSFERGVEGWFCGDSVYSVEKGREIRRRTSSSVLGGSTLGSLFQRSL